MRTVRRLFILVFLAFFWTAPKVSANSLVLSEGLKLEPMKYLSETVNAVEARIQAWDTALLKEGTGIRRLISGPYGSAFLKLNKKGMDQDYLCVFDLGMLKNGSPQDQATELITKINRIFNVVTQVNNSISNNAKLHVYYDGPAANADAKLGDKAHALIAEQMASIKSGAQIRSTFYNVRNDLVPADIYPFEILVPINTRIKMASNTVKYYPGMFSGIREISVQFLYNVAIEKDGRPVYFNVSPLYDREASTLHFFDLMSNSVFLSKRNADIYLQRIMRLPTKEVVLYTVITLYQQSLTEYADGRYLKLLKRLHQSYNALKWAFTPREQATIENALRRWLQSDWAVLAEDVVEQSKMWREADGQLAPTFIRAGTFDRLLEFLREVVRLEPKYPTLKPDFDNLRNIVNDLKDRKELGEKFKRLQSAGETLSKKMGPSQEDMAKLLALFGDKLKELGFKSVDIYRLQGMKLTLSRDQLVEAGLVPEAVNLPPEQGGVKKIGGYDYTVVEKLGPDEKPIRTIFFRSVFTGESADKFKKYYAAIPYRFSPN